MIIPVQILIEPDMDQFLPPNANLSHQEKIQNESWFELSYEYSESKSFEL